MKFRVRKTLDWVDSRTGLETAVRSFANPRAFAQYHVLSKLAPALTEIFASDDGEFAKIFSTYMQPQAKTEQPKGEQP